MMQECSTKISRGEFHALYKLLSVFGLWAVGHRGRACIFRTLPNRPSEDSTDLASLPSLSIRNLKVQSWAALLRGTSPPFCHSVYCRAAQPCLDVCPSEPRE
jgi:hypothetical protein